MRLTKFIQCISCLTFVALAYIHVQMQIIDLAYQGKAKEKQIRKLLEENGELTYAILTLKSANHLGIKVLTEDSDMKFVDPDNIVQISTSSDYNNDHVVIESPAENNSTQTPPLFHLLSVSSEAQAQE